MVYVQRPKGEGEGSDGGAKARLAGVKSPLPAAKRPTKEAAPNTDPFDQIDRLLAPSSTETESPGAEAVDPRWKLPPSEGTAPQAPVAADPEVSPAPREPLPPGQAEPEFLPATQEISTSRQIGWLRRLALVAVGTVAGAGLAVGIFGFVLSRSHDVPARPAQPVAQVAGPSAQTANRLAPGLGNTPEIHQANEKSTPRSATTQETSRPGDPALQGPAVADPARRADHQQTDADGPTTLTDVPPSPPVAPPPKDSPELASEGPDVADPPVVPIQPDPPVSQPRSDDSRTGLNPLLQKEPLPPEPQPPSDDLASFAQWLENPAGVDASAAISDLQSSSQPARQGSSAGVQPPSGPSVSRPVPPSIDVARHLTDRISAIQFRETPLPEALRTLSDLSTIPVTIEPWALIRAGEAPDRPVSFTQRDVTVGELLDHVLKPLGLGYSVTEGQLVVTTRAKAAGEMIQWPHAAGDLIQNQPQALDQLASWIPRLVAPDSWSEADAAIEAKREDQAVLIRHFDTVQAEVLAFLERLRLARGLPAQSRLKSAYLQLPTRCQLALSWLEKPITIRCARPTRWHDLVRQLEPQAGIRVFIDWQAFHAAGWSPGDEVTWFVVDRPLEEALDELLTPLGLAYRVIDAHTLELTSSAAAARQLDLEFYRLPDQIETADQIEQFVDELKREVGPPAFHPVGRGDVLVDMASRHLIVSLPQHQQRAVAEYLASGAARKVARTN